MDSRMMMDTTQSKSGRKQGGRKGRGNGRGGGMVMATKTTGMTMYDLTGVSGSDAAVTASSPSTTVQKHEYAIVSSTSSSWQFDKETTLKALQLTGLNKNTSTRRYLRLCQQKTCKVYKHGPLTGKVTMFECGTEHVSEAGKRRFDSILHGYISISVDGREVFISDMSGYQAEAAFKELGATSCTRHCFARAAGLVSSRSSGKWNVRFDVTAVDTIVKKSQFGWVGDVEDTKSLVRRNLPSALAKSEWTIQLLQKKAGGKQLNAKQLELLQGVTKQLQSKIPRQPTSKQDMPLVEEALTTAVAKYMACPGNGQARTVKAVSKQSGKGKDRGYRPMLWNKTPTESLEVHPTSLKDVVKGEARVLADVISFCVPVSNDKKQVGKDKTAMMMLIAQLLTYRKPVAKK